jgi:choline dehydrogenase
MSDDPTEPDSQPFDYIVVGSGAGGAPLAANLAEAGMRVLVLEAGGSATNDNYEVPAFNGHAVEDPDLRWDYYVRHYSDEARQSQDCKYKKEDGGVYYPRSGTVGGCTAHHALITMYPFNSDWDDIARATGDRSWASSAMRSYFERLERWERASPPKRLPKDPILARLLVGLPLVSRRFVNTGRHGFDGWLPTTFADEKLILRDRQLIDQVAAAAKEALEEFLGRPLKGLENLDSLADPNHWTAVSKGLEGLWRIPISTADGRRSGARERLLSAAARLPNLTVTTDALVTKVLFDGGRRAVGVEYRAGPRSYRAAPPIDATAGPASDSRRVLCGREVILAAGTFNTPQILKLSGIGPAQELKCHGIEVLHDLPGVGENLQDRYEISVVSRVAYNFSLLDDNLFHTPAGGQVDPAYDRWKKDGTGIYTTNGVVIGISRRSHPDLPDPDLFIFGVPGDFRGYYRGFSSDVLRHRDRFTWVVLKAHTLNKAGRVLLRSADPTETPKINFHYFEEGTDVAQRDLDAVVEGVRIARSINSRVGDDIRGELWPSSKVSTPEEIAEFVRAQAWGHHASSTCKMGSRTDPGAVVDSTFRVYGTSGLRVVDASVFPRIPGFFIVTPTYMISEKASRAILADAGSAHGSAGNTPFGMVRDQAQKGSRRRPTMTVGAKTMSSWDTARLQLQVGAVALLWGLVVPNRLLVPLLCRRDLGQLTPQLMSALRRKYGTEHLWTRFPVGRRTLVVLDPDSMDEVLESECNAADPVLKKRAFANFVPEALVISSGKNWQDRRAFNERALHTGHRHEQATVFQGIVSRAVNRLAIRQLDVLRWKHFKRLSRQIAQEIIIGSDGVDPKLVDLPLRMAARSNLILFGGGLSSRRRLHRRLAGSLARQRPTGSRAAQGHPSGDGLPFSLTRDAPQRGDDGAVTTRTCPEDQIGFWMYVLPASIELHVARTLALIASDGGVQDRVRDEIGRVSDWTPDAIDGLTLLHACFQEQLRLWTPVPLLLRRTTAAFHLRDEILLEPEDQILLPIGAYHRDSAVFGERADRFAPDLRGGDGPPTYSFSRHRQSCAGEQLATFTIVATLAYLLKTSRFQLRSERIDPQCVPHMYNHFAVALRAIQ